jgi:hypothetical protein
MWPVALLKILWHVASGLTSPLNEDVMRIFIALKNQSLALARFEPANIGSNGKHPNR